MILCHRYSLITVIWLSKLYWYQMSLVCSFQLAGHAFHLQMTHFIWCFSPDHILKSVSSFSFPLPFSSFCCSGSHLCSAPANHQAESLRVGEGSVSKSLCGSRRPPRIPRLASDSTVYLLAFSIQTGKSTQNRPTVKHSPDFSHAFGQRTPPRWPPFTRWHSRQASSFALGDEVLELEVSRHCPFSDSLQSAQ